MSPKQTRTADYEDHLSALTFQSDTADAVFLAGSFNNWNPMETPMVRDEDGQWTASLNLAPGRYEYKFVVDGDWCCEPECTVPNVDCTHCIMNDFGTMNRVLAVP